MITPKDSLKQFFTEGKPLALKGNLDIPLVSASRILLPMVYSTSHITTEDWVTKGANMASKLLKYRGFCFRRPLSGGMHMTIYKATLHPYLVVFTRAPLLHPCNRARK